MTSAAAAPRSKPTSDNRMALAPRTPGRSSRGSGAADSQDSGVLDLDTLEQQLQTEALQDPMYNALSAQAQLWAEQYDCIEKFTAFQQVMQDHKEWRLVLIGAALELTRDHRSCPVLVSELCRLCLMVQDTSKAVRALRQEREQVRLYNQKSGRFDALIAANVSTQQVLQAMDQTAGIDSPDIGLRVALKLSLYMDAVHQLPNTLPAASPVPEDSAASGSTLEQQQQRATSCLTISQINRPVKVGLGGNFMGIGLKADLEVPAPGNLHMKREVEKAGEELLSDIMHKPSYPYSLASMKREEVVNQDFLNLNAKYCIAYVANAKVVEVYKIFEPHTGYGYIELVNVVSGVKQMPEWRNILVQEFTNETEKKKVGGIALRQSSASKECEGYQLPSRRSLSRRSPYIPVKLQSADLERLVEGVLQARNIKGGCWETIIHGRLPASGFNVEGFRTVPMCVAVAGLAIWFTSKAYKKAAWLEFDNIMLTGQQHLRLGHCDVSVQSGGREDGAPGKVTFAAAAESPIWKKECMWG